MDSEDLENFEGNFGSNFSLILKAVCFILINILKLCAIILTRIDTKPTLNGSLTWLVLGIPRSFPDLDITSKVRNKA